MCVNGSHVALEFGVLAGLTIDGKLSVQNQFIITGRGILRGLSEGCDHKLGVLRLELLTQSLDQANEIFLVLNRVTIIVAILIALPPGEAFNLVASSLPMGELFVKIVQYLVGGPETVVVLFTGIPVDRLWLRAFFPRERSFLIPGIDLSAVFESLASRCKEVPRE